MRTLFVATIILPVATLWMVAHATREKIDPNMGIKKRLRDFIALAESIDFDAKAENQAYPMEFIYADYRAQSDEWKLLYRIGREQVLATRDMARSLLNEFM